MAERDAVRLAEFNNSWYEPGRPLWIRAAWMAANRAFLLTSFPWPYAVKRAVLRAFGAKVGRGVVVKPRVTVKYPWRLRLGDDAWVGESVWIDCLASVSVGANVCLSQACMIETGNHDWSSPTFDLRLGEVTLEEGSWAAVRSLLLPGSRLARHAVLGAGSVLAGDTEEEGVYVGVPAVKVKERALRAAG
ncbi:MAG TPA: WcaF family extracellular polysaccharide biosynthesis acetyltransferase [Anaeromyxobacteraceae bacterium]|nr:WcaF family extracellular polysaccharide biosynthesis acetyltransferase [Anaeromyxobacteraceae bacterium]